MSWWIMEHIAVNDDETKQMCSIQADTQTDLPAVDQTATAGFIIVRGSDALVVDTGDRYILDSGGTWRQQPSGVQLDLSGYATTQDLTDGLAAKVDTTTYTAGQAEQDTEIVSKITMQQAYGDGTLIESNSNLNTYTTAGLYYATIAVAATLTNSPYTSSGFKLVVEKNILSGAAVFHTLIPTSGTNVSSMYKRVYENGAWGSWYRFDGVPV